MKLGNVLMKCIDCQKQFTANLGAKHIDDETAKLNFLNHEMLEEDIPSGDQVL